jgi:hypothetical protein
MDFASNAFIDINGENQLQHKLNSVTELDNKLQFYW